jgi:hypothetical protein
MRIEKSVTPSGWRASNPTLGGGVGSGGARNAAEQRYSPSVKQIWTGQAARVAARYGEHAPLATACCNTCRACVTSNILGLAMAGAVGALAAVRRVLRTA